MSQVKTILLSFAFLAFFFCTQANGSFLSGSLTIMNAHASSSGIVELKKESGNSSESSSTFYVEADLADHPQNSSATVKMMISISNVESMVALNCLNFSRFDCTKYDCSQFGGSKHIEYPTFTAEGLNGRSDMYLDYNYWSFAETSDYLYHAQECDSRATIANIATLGAERYGVLGLGTSEKSRDHFRSSNNFSIYIESDLSKGKLLFKNDTETYAQSSEPLLKLAANTTWQTTFISDASIQIGDKSLDIVGSLAFDINSNATSLPWDTFAWIVDYFRDSLGMKCDTAYSRPVCNSTQRIQDLPNITLAISKNRNITIPPKIYASVISDKEGGSSFSLNLKGTDPAMTGENYVTPTFKFAIIFDANFMSYYYTVFAFSKGNNVISLYYAKHPDPVDPSNPNPAVLIALLVIGVVIAVGVYCYCAKKKKSVANDSVNAPLVLSDSAYQNPERRGAYPPAPVAGGGQ